MSRTLTSLLLAMLVLAGAMGLKTVVAAHSNGAAMMANGADPVPRLLVARNGADPVPRLLAARNGADPVPRLVARNGADPVPRLAARNGADPVPRRQSAR